MYSNTGTKAGTHELNSAIFEVPWNEALVHQALVWQKNNSRRPVAKTKTRSDRRGGGRKPWRQKGTGRARAGSTRSPLWRKGGVTFGPRGVENYRTTLTKKQRHLALFSALSQKARDGEIIGVDSFTLDAPKTKTFATMIAKLPVKRSCLFVIPEKNEVVQKSARNISGVKVIYASYLNVADLLTHQAVVCLKDSFQKIDELWLEEAKQLSKAKSRSATAGKKQSTSSKKTATKKS